MLDPPRFKSQKPGMQSSDALNPVQTHLPVLMDVRPGRCTCTRRVNAAEPNTERSPQVVPM